MAKKKLITLAKELDFEYDYEYFDYMIDTYINGQFTQCKSLFNEMKKEDQKNFIKYMGQSKTKEYYFNLL